MYRDRDGCHKKMMTFVMMKVGFFVEGEDPISSLGARLMRRMK